MRLAAVPWLTACHAAAEPSYDAFDPSGESSAAEDEPDGADENATTGAGDDADPPTYYRDVGPILARRCVGCHIDDGIAPFPLDEYEDAAAWADAIVPAVTHGSMPPLPANPTSCRPIEDPRIMKSQERDTLAAWVESGMAKGDPGDAPMPEPTEDPLGTPTIVLDSGLDYESDAGSIDEYRCFVVDTPLADSLDVVAAWVRSTNPAIVHHAFVEAVPANAASDVAALEAADPEPGWECFSGSGVPGAKRIGGVVPGGEPRAFPAGTGVSLAAGTRFVVLMHYNYLNNTDPNRFSVELWEADGPVTGAPGRARAVEGSFVLPAGESDIVAVGETRIVGAMQVPGNGEARAGLAWDAGAHMHMLGVAAQLELVRNDGSVECLLDIDTWDFHWQGDYPFVDPIELRAGDTLRLTCRWDNSAANQPIIDGVPQTPRDVRWGESSLDEMCLGGLTTTPMP